MTIVESIELPHLGFVPMNEQQVADHERRGEALLAAADAYILVVDLQDPMRLKQARERLEQLAAKAAGKPILVVGNKADVAGQGHLARTTLARSLGLLGDRASPTELEGPRYFARAACGGKLPPPLPQLPSELVRRIFDSLWLSTGDALLLDGQAVRLGAAPGAPPVLLRMGSALHLSQLAHSQVVPHSTPAVLPMPSARLRRSALLLSTLCRRRLGLANGSLWRAAVACLSPGRAEAEQVVWSYAGAELACQWRRHARLGCGDAVNSGMLVLNGLHWLGSQVQLRRMHAGQRVPVLSGR